MSYINYQSGVILTSKGEQFTLKEVNIDRREKTISGVLVNWNNNKHLTNSFCIVKEKKDGREKWKFEIENNNVILKHINLEILIRDALINVGYDINF